jgi:putative hemolysin
MKNKVIIIFIILILGLILFSFLGNHTKVESFTNNIEENFTNNDEENSDYNSNQSYKNNNYDNYNHYTGSSSTISPGTYYGPNGGTLVATANSNGSMTFTVTLPGSTTSNVYTSPSPTTNSKTVYYGKNGGTATVITTKNGSYGIKVVPPGGKVFVYTQTANLDENNGSSAITPGTYYGPNGGTLVATANTDGSMTFTVTLPGSSTSNVYTSPSPTTNTKTVYYGKNGGTATIITVQNGSYGIKVVSPNGQIIIYTKTENFDQNSGLTSTMNYGSTGSTIPSNYNLAYTNSNNMTNSSKTIYYGPNGAIAIVNSNNSITVTRNGNTINYTKINNNTSVFTGTDGTTIYINKSGNGTINLVLKETNGTTEVFTSNNNTSYYSGSTSNPSNSYYSGSTSNPSSSYYSGSNSNNTYNSVYPQGVTKSQIPPGQENLYILKSEIVPPVCPACPPVSVYSSKKEKCNPCPPCARCPDPKFTCKKVPNYGSSYNSAYYGTSGYPDDETSSSYLPVPILNDFSTFGT